ncbi:MAG: HNH endonuclease [Clostridiales bacterium]|nr:HNH endonuclease [Clostridiales bacterium]
MELIYILLYVFIGIAVIALAAFIIYSILKSPFKYPYYTVTFDVSGKRSPNVEDLLDEHINTYGIAEFTEHCKSVAAWKASCRERIEKSKLKNLRTRQYEEIIDDNNMFCFELIRKQTRYKQVNYVKSSYVVHATVAKYTYNIHALQQRFDALSNIGFECTLSEYHSKDQRKRMTKALREEIAVRDNYTCRICGKYMPDGVGLHIDHIIPVAKGGKSIPSNLQVLCSKCNGKKSSKENYCERGILGGD